MLQKIIIIILLILSFFTVFAFGIFGNHIFYKDYWIAKKIELLQTPNSIASQIDRSEYLVYYSDYGIVDGEFKVTINSKGELLYEKQNTQLIFQVDSLISMEVIHDFAKFYDTSVVYQNSQGLGTKCLKIEYYNSKEIISVKYIGTQGSFFNEIRLRVLNILNKKLI